jgi:hypothetical protein
VLDIILWTYLAGLLLTFLAYLSLDRPPGISIGFAVAASAVLALFWPITLASTLIARALR